MLLLELSILQRPELHLDMSGQHEPLLLLDVSKLKEDELHQDISRLQEPVLLLDLCTLKQRPVLHPDASRQLKLCWTGRV